MSALHCLGMCGSIVSALTFSLPREVRGQRGRLLAYLTAYNLGRLGSYLVAGALVGGAGTALAQTITLQHGHQLLSVAGALLMTGIGLYLAGWFPRFAQLERIGAPIWQRLEPLSRRLLPVRNLPQAFLFGLIWGWLPCGLVYSALIWSATAGSAGDGALLMAAFGVGTLPSMLSAGLLMGWLTRAARHTLLRQAVGVSMILLALFMLAWSFGYPLAEPAGG